MASFKTTKLVKTATEAFENYEYSKVRLATDLFFWNTLCDNYLELVKDRLYNPDTRGKEARLSGQYALYQAVSTVLKLYAPIVSFVTEEIYSWHFAKLEGEESIHKSAWPIVDEELISDDFEARGDEIIKVVETMRKFRAEYQMSMKEELSKINIKSKNNLNDFVDDLKATTKAKEIILEESEFDVSIEK
jgi:valyl-tRNA synthetase